MKIAVAGTGYVGLANAVLFAVNNEVTAFDIDQKRIELLEKKISPIKDKEIEAFLAEKELNIRFFSDPQAAYKDADFDYKDNWLEQFDWMMDVAIRKKVLKIICYEIVIKAQNIIG
jgi:3-hydroxyacyl-CoA dehydrogenase